MSVIRADYPDYLWAGLALLAMAAACNDLATVPYNAMLSQLDHAKNSGRVSGAGLAVGYGGSVALLLIIYVGFIVGKDDTAACWACPSAMARTSGRRWCSRRCGSRCSRCRC